MKSLFYFEIITGQMIVSPSFPVAIRFLPIPGDYTGITGLYHYHSNYKGLMEITPTVRDKVSKSASFRSTVYCEVCGMDLPYFNRGTWPISRILGTGATEADSAIEIWQVHGESIGTTEQLLE
jgi:hypothetical protein